MPNTANKTPEQLIEILKKEALLIDASLAIIEGYNHYGFSAEKIPPESITFNEDRTSAVIRMAVGADREISASVPLQPTDKSIDFWIIRNGENPDKCDIITIRYDKPEAADEKELEQKEYMSVMCFFFQLHGINTRGKMMKVLKDGYKLLKESTGEEDEFELLHDKVMANRPKQYRVVMKNVEY